MGIRFIHQEDPSLLRQSAGHERQLTLAAAHRIKPPVPKVFQSNGIERFLRDADVATPWSLEQSEVRSAPQQDHVLDGHPEQGNASLRNKPDNTGSPPPRHVLERCAFQEDPTRLRDK